MNDNLATEKRLKDALKSIGAECNEIQRSSDLITARTKKQMDIALAALNLRKHQLEILVLSCTEQLSNIRKEEEKLSLVQQFQAKMVNISKDMGISVDQAYQLLMDCDKKSRG